MGDIAKRFADESDFRLATELTFISLASDASQQVIGQMAAFLDFKTMVLFLTVFGGKRISIPTLDHFTERITLARAALDVVMKRITIKHAARKYNVASKDVAPLVNVLRKHMAFKRNHHRLYRKGDSQMFAKLRDISNQTPVNDESEE